MDAACLLSTVLVLLALLSVRRGLLFMLPPGLRMKSMTLRGRPDDEALIGREDDDARDSSLCRGMVSSPGILGGTLYSCNCRAGEVQFVSRFVVEMLHKTYQHAR